MKSLFLVLAWLGQFQVVELETKSPSNIFLQEELAEPPKRKVDSRPTFDLLSAPWCGACLDVYKALGGASNGVFDRDGRFIVRVHNVDSSGWLGANSIPAFAYKGRVFQYGYSNPENLLENFRKANPQFNISDKPNNWPSYQGYNPRWTWPGDLRTHLRQVHGVTESLTQDQAEALHDALHEGYTLQQIRNRFKGN